MKSLLSTSLFAAVVAGHATFQDLWINGVDMQSSCVRLPTSNNPVQDVTSNNVRCNINTAAAGKCTVAAGSTVTVEMHQQPGDRSCVNEAIGGAHYGPVLGYMTKVTDASTADGSTGWFKIFQDGWAKVAGSSNGAADGWGTKDLNTCCGKMNFKIPSDIPAGDYLLRAEAIALHAAQSSGGAQLYMSCYQITVTGGGSASPPTVLFPGAYKATDPGILIDIYSPIVSYVVPGPAVYSGGSTKSAGAACSGAELGTTTGPVVSATKAASSTTTAVVTTTKGTTLATSTTSSSKVATSTTSSSKAATSTAGGSTGCTTAKYGQCGGNGFTGCTTCAAGSTCQASSVYYSQCL